MDIRFVLIFIGVLLFIDWTHANYHDALKWRALQGRRELAPPTDAQLAGAAQICREGAYGGCLALQEMVERRWGGRR
jgi:hypothetical protein